MKLCYIAGPYRADTRGGIAQNINNADKAGRIAARLGYYPVVPHKNTEHYEDKGIGQPDQFYLDGTLTLMEKCDFLLIVPNWEGSSGTCGEINRAHSLGLPIYFLSEDFKTDLPVA